MISATVASLLLIAVLFSAFRLAMGLRHAKLVREQALQDELARGRRVIAEVPTPGGEIELFREDARGFYWSSVELGKPALAGARLTLNGAVMKEASRPGTDLPTASPPEEYEGRERWEVVVYREAAPPFTIQCGSLREGVSRDAARAVFEAVAAACTAAR